MRFADIREDRAGDEGRSRMIGFSRGLQDGLRRRIEKMVRKPTSQDMNFHTCTEGGGSDEIPNPDFEERGNCDEGRNCKKVNCEGNLASEARPRRAWPTPRRVNNLKVTIMAIAMMTMEMVMAMPIAMRMSNMQRW